MKIYDNNYMKVIALIAILTQSLSLHGMNTTCCALKKWWYSKQSTSLSPRTYLDLLPNELHNKILSFAVQHDHSDVRDYLQVLIKNGEQFGRLITGGSISPRITMHINLYVYLEDKTFQLNMSLVQKIFFYNYLVKEKNKHLINFYKSLGFVVEHELCNDRERIANFIFDKKIT